MYKKNFSVFAGLGALGLVLLTVFLAASGAFKNRHSQTFKSWNFEAIKATYVASQLKETDKTYSTLILSYDLENNTDSDFRLDAGPGIVVLSRLKADGSLSQQEPLRLSYPVFLPAHQHARMAIEITDRFAWPLEKDPDYIDRFRDFVKQRLAGVGEFVLFDQASHVQIKLPGAWPELQETARASY